MTNKAAAFASFLKPTPETLMLNTLSQANSKRSLIEALTQQIKLSTKREASDSRNITETIAKLNLEKSVLATTNEKVRHLFETSDEPHNICGETLYYTLEFFCKKVKGTGIFVSDASELDASLKAKRYITFGDDNYDANGITLTELFEQARA